MNGNKSHAPTWDSLVTLLICAVIAIAVITVGAAWLGKPEFVSEPVAHETTHEVDSSFTDMTELPAVTSVTDISQESDDSSLANTESQSGNDSQKQYVVVTVKSAVIRNSNSADSDVVAYVSKGKKFEVIDKKGKWYCIIYMDKACWIHKNCVEFCE